MPVQRIAGIALIVTGLVLMYFGYQSSQGLDDQLSETLTGEYTDSTVWYWLSGSVASVAGLLMILVRRG